MNIKIFLKGVLEVPIAISNFFQSFLGTLIGMITAFVFCGTIFSWGLNAIAEFLFFRLGFGLVILHFWGIIHLFVEFYCVYVTLATFITIFPSFSYKGKHFRGGVIK